MTSTATSSHAGGGSGRTVQPPSVGSFGSPLVWVLGGLSVLLLLGMALVVGAAARQYGVDTILAEAVAIVVVLAVAGLIAGGHAWANRRRSRDGTKAS